MTDGVGCVARRGGEVETILSGDVVQIEPGEEHRHGATATSLMVHVAMNEVGDETDPASWVTVSRMRSTVPREPRR